MSLTGVPINGIVTEKPSLAIAYLLAAKQGLTVYCSGIRRFDLDASSIEEIALAVADPKFDWKEPHCKKMKSALTLNLDRTAATLLFVIDKSLSAEFSQTLPAIFAGDEQSARALADMINWTPQTVTQVASVTVQLDGLPPGNVQFNLGLDNVGVLGPDKVPYRTPIIIDPDIPHPPLGGGLGGGGPP